MSLIQIQSFPDYVPEDTETLKTQNPLCTKLQIQVLNCRQSWPQGDASEVDSCHLPETIFTGYMNTDINSIDKPQLQFKSLPGSFTRDAFPTTET